MLRHSTQSRTSPLPLPRGAGARRGGWRTVVPAPTMNVLTRLWFILRWFWAALLLGWLTATYVSLLAGAGQQGVADLPLIHLAVAYPWPVLGALALLVLLTLAAYLAYRVQGPWSPYVLKRVVTLALEAGRFVPRYLEPFYLYRVADPDAREALRLAARRTGEGEPLGICVTGWPMLGKTRMAWEAIQAELPEWTLVQWPLEGQPAFDFAALRGKQLVLWLDDLHKYATLNLAPTVNDLPRRFAQAGARVVVVATCRDSDEAALAAAGLGPLLTRLIEVRPGRLGDSDVAWHVAALKYLGIKLLLDQFDGTPGSVLLGAQRMREEGYPALPRSARRVLWAMKLLRSAGIYAYPQERVRAAVQDVFRLEPREWRLACKALERAGFVRFTGRPGGKGRALVPVADLYLDDIVPDFSAPGAHISEGWPELEKSLASRRDADALNQLGLAFLELDVGDLQSNARHAESCFRAALAIYQPRSAHAAWAIAERNLGLAYWSQAQVSAGAERAMLLERAAEAYRLAWRVAVWEYIPLHCALTQQSLGAALNGRAALVEVSERAQLLEASISAYQEALLSYQRSRALDEWAMTQQNLGTALSDQARLAGGEQRAKLLGQAVEAYGAALSVYTREETPRDWAMTHNNLGIALLQQVELAGDAQQQTLLAEVLACHQAALDIYNREETPGSWATTQVNLANVYRHQAALAADEQRAPLLALAIDAYRAALEVYTSERAPDGWAMTQNNLGNALSDQALLLSGKEQQTLLRQVIAAHRAALTIYTRDYAPVEWAGTEFNLARTHLLLAHSFKSGQHAKARALSQAAACVKHALEIFNPATAPTYHAQAAQLQQEIAEYAAVAPEDAPS